MLTFLNTWFIVGFVVLVIIGIVFKSVRLFVLSLAFGMLILGLIIENVIAKKPKKKIQKHKEIVEFGRILISSGKLRVTDKWDVQKADSVSFDPGEYSVILNTLLDENGMHVTGLNLRALEYTNSLGQEQSMDVSVDTGVLTIIDSDSEKDGITPKRIKTATLDLLESEDLPARLLTDENGIARGLVVETGYGDGIYRVDITRDENSKLELMSEFVRDA